MFDFSSGKLSLRNQFTYQALGIKALLVNTSFRCRQPRSSNFQGGDKYRLRHLNNSPIQQVIQRSSFQIPSFHRSSWRISGKKLWHSNTNCLQLKPPSTLQMWDDFIRTFKPRMRGKRELPHASCSLLCYIIDPENFELQEKSFEELF